MTAVRDLVGRTVHVSVLGHDKSVNIISLDDFTNLDIGQIYCMTPWYHAFARRKSQHCGLLGTIDVEPFQTNVTPLESMKCRDVKD